MLLDEPLCIEVSNQSMGRNFIRHMFELDNYAWALVRGAHLNTSTQSMLSAIHELFYAEDGSGQWATPTKVSTGIVVLLVVFLWRLRHLL